MSNVSPQQPHRGRSETGSDGQRHHERHDGGWAPAASGADAHVQVHDAQQKAERPYDRQYQGHRSIVADDFGHWLAGFIDGEGCFYISKKHNRSGRICHRCGFSLCLRADERPILAEICERTGIGKIYTRPTRSDNLNPQLVWCVDTMADCLGLVDLMDRYPLRAKKLRDFDIWSVAVRYQHSTRRGGGQWRPEERQAHLATLHAQLTDARAYAA